MSRHQRLYALVPVILFACGGEPREEESGTVGSDTTAATTSAATAAAAGGQDKVANAMSAAPEAIARNATIMDWPEKEGGQPKQLRAGTNGWTCFPTSPAAAGAAGEDPMCLDKEFAAWGEAWMSKKKPQLKNIGIAYMLRGDAGASNTDPYATKQTSDNQWVKAGPHLMVVSPNPALLEGLPRIRRTVVPS